LTESVVVDASVDLSWVPPGEDTHDVIKLRDRAADKPGMLLLVPPTFWYEVANALWVATRRQRIAPGVAAETLSALRDFGCEEWEPDPAACEAVTHQGSWLPAPGTPERDGMDQCQEHDGHRANRDHHRYDAGREITDH